MAAGAIVSVEFGDFTTPARRVIPGEVRRWKDNAERANNDPDAYYFHSYHYIDMKLRYSGASADTL